jgi:tetratricopeptide (TPR) repeat protein
MGQRFHSRSSSLRPLGFPRVRATFLALLSAFLLAALASGQAQIPADSAPSARSVIQALQSHDNAEALRLAQLLVQAHPADPRAWTLQGIAFASLQRRDESLNSFEQALNIDPNNLPALRAAAQLEFQANSPKALAFLQKLLVLNPGDQTAHAMTAALAFQQKDCSAAVDHYQHSLQVISADLSALSEFAACLLHLNRPTDALMIYQQIASLRPQDVEPLYYIALAQFSAHRYPNAVQTLVAIIDRGTEKERAAALNLLAAVYEDSQQTTLAVAALQKAIALAPNDPDNYLDLATIALDHNSFQLGIDVVNAGLHALPDSAPLLLERGVLEVQLGQYDQANTDFRESSALNPREDYGSVALGISLLQENKIDDSIGVVRQRLTNSPNDPTLNYFLADLLIRKGAAPGTPSFQQAKAAVVYAVQLSPDFTLALDLLTELYLRSGETKLAEQTARTALKADPNDQPALYHLIACLRERGDHTELPQLVQRLATVTATLREQEQARNRFKLVEEQSSVASQGKGTP